jgi:antitoxin ParD1/3/4
MPTMNVSLPDDLNEFVADQLANGGYNNQSEVVRDALRLLRVRSEARRQLNERLDRGTADADAGRTKPFTRELLEKVVERSKERKRKPEVGAD